MGGAGSCCGGRSVSVMATNTDAQPWTRDEGVGASAADLLAKTVQTQNEEEDELSSRTSSCVSVDSIHVDSIRGDREMADVGDNGATFSAVRNGALYRDRTFVLDGEETSAIGQASRRNVTKDNISNRQKTFTRPRSRNRNKSKKSHPQRTLQSVAASEVRKQPTTTQPHVPAVATSSRDNKLRQSINNKQPVYKHNNQTKPSDGSVVSVSNIPNGTTTTTWDPHCGDFTSAGVRGRAAHLYARDGSTVSAGTSGNDLHANTQRNNQVTTEKAKPDRAEYDGFFVPMDSYAEPTPTKKPRKKGKNGTAFVIKFNDSGIDSESLGGQDDDNSDEHARNDDKTVIPPKPTKSSDYTHSYSNGRRQSIFNGPPFALRTNQSRSNPIRETLKHYDAYKQARRSIEKPNFRTLSPNPVNIVAPDQRSNNRNISTPATTMATKRPYAIRNSVTKNHRFPLRQNMNSKYRSDKKKSKDELIAEVEALNQHIRDLRQLLRLQIRHRSNDELHGTATQTAFGQKLPTSGSPATNLSKNLVQNFQAEIVRLENELVAKQSSLENREMSENNQTNDNDPEEDGHDEENDDNGMTSSASETDSNELSQSYKQALSNLDHDFATQLASAEGSISDDELRALLDAHIAQRQQLKDEMLPANNNGQPTSELAVNRSATFVANENETSPDVTSSRKSTSVKMVDGCCGPDIRSRETRDQAVSSANASSINSEVQTVGHDQPTVTRDDAYTQYDKGASTEDDGDDDNERIKLTINSFTEAAISRDEAFTQTVWARRQDMSPDELQRLLAEHFQDVSSLRKMRKREHDKLADRLKSKLAGRNDSKSDDSANDESDTEENTTTVDHNEALVEEEEEDSSTTWRPERLPVSCEEMEKILEEHRERQRRILEKQMEKDRHHRDSIARRLRMRQYCKENNRNSDKESTTDTDEADVSHGTNAQTTETTTETSMCSQDAQTMIDMKARQTGGKDESGAGCENAQALITAHRDRRKDLQRWRNEDKQAKDENLRNKLTTRLQNRNISNVQEHSNIDSSDV